MIMRDVNYGWMIRYLHANTASFFFLFVYLHILVDDFSILSQSATVLERNRGAKV